MPLYFAYGANMSETVLSRRLGRTAAVDLARRRGVLCDYKLVFNKRSSTDPLVGYANVVPAGGHRVEGVLNQLTDGELARLDDIELVPHHYVRSRLTVHDSAGPVAAHVYLAHPAWIRGDLRPLRGYLDVLLGGAGLLSPEYVGPLRALPCRDEELTPQDR